MQHKSPRSNTYCTIVQICTERCIIASLKLEFERTVCNLLLRLWILQIQNHAMTTVQKYCLNVHEINRCQTKI